MNSRNLSQTKRSILVEQIINCFFGISACDPLAKEVLKEMQKDIYDWMISIDVSWSEFKFSQLGQYCLAKDA